MDTARVKQSPLIAIVGPTASGKSDVAMAIAQKFDGEIICADSRTIYKGMDIGTAKPSVADRARVVHWGLDLVEPGERFTVADFQHYALEKIEDIRQRGKVPLLVGGTGLYVDSVVLHYQFCPESAPQSRRFLQAMSIDELHEYCLKHNVELPENQWNKRYVIRTIERNGGEGKRLFEPDATTTVVGIATEKQVLRKRIQERARLLFEQGVINEARTLAWQYGWDNEAMTGNIYRLAKQYIDQQITEEQLYDAFVVSDWRLAKRQLTWLRRHAFIHWIERDNAEQYISKTIADYYGS